MDAFNFHLIGNLSCMVGENIVNCSIYQENSFKASPKDKKKDYNEQNLSDLLLTTINIGVGII